MPQFITDFLAYQIPYLWLSLYQIGLCGLALFFTIIAAFVLRAIARRLVKKIFGRFGEDLVTKIVNEISRPIYLTVLGFGMALSALTLPSKLDDVHIPADWQTQGQEEVSPEADKPAGDTKEAVKAEDSVQAKKPAEASAPDGDDELAEADRETEMDADEEAELEAQTEGKTKAKATKKKKKAKKAKKTKKRSNRANQEPEDDPPGSPGDDPAPEQIAPDDTTPAADSPSEEGNTKAKAGDDEQAKAEKPAKKEPKNPLAALTGTADDSAKTTKSNKKAADAKANAEDERVRVSSQRKLNVSEEDEENHMGTNFFSYIWSIFSLLPHFLLFFGGLALGTFNLFWLLSRSLRMAWDDYLWPLIDKNVEGKEKRFFPIIFKVLNIVLWLSMVVTLIQFWGLDAWVLIGKILGLIIADNTIAQYLSFAGLCFFTLILARTLFNQLQRAIRIIQHRTNRQDLEEVWFSGLDKPLLYLIILIGMSIAITVLEEKAKNPDTGEVSASIVRLILGIAANIAIILNISWLMLILVDKIFEHLVQPLVESSKIALDGQLIPLIKKFLKGFIGMIAFIAGIQATGHDPFVVLTALGGLGVVIGLAAQNQVSPFIAGLVNYMMRPYKLGDYIQADSFEGTVEAIDLRATLLRTKEGFTILVPNDKLLSAGIFNYTSSGGVRDCAILRVDIAEPPAQRDRAMDIFRQAVIDTPDCERPFVRFFEYGDDNMGMELSWWVTDSTKIYEVQHNIMIQLDEGLREANIHLSTPTRSLAFTGYLGGEPPKIHIIHEKKDQPEG